MVHSQSPLWKRITKSFSGQTMMGTLGATVTDVCEGGVEITLPAAPHVCQQHGFIHGGALMAIADTASGYAAYTTVPPDKEVLTVEFKLNFLRPAQGNAVASAQVVRAGKSIIVVSSDVSCDDKIVATGLGTFAVVEAPTAR